MTGLPLPDPVVIRTMTVDNWLKEHEKSAQRRLTVETEELDPSQRERLAAQAKCRAMHTFLSTFWPTMAAESVLFEAGQPEVVLLPEALQDAGRLHDIPRLYKALGHEMTHQAQYMASGGAVWVAQETFFPARRGTAGRDYKFLLEGHAYWADRQITAKVFGKPVSIDEPSPLASDRYRRLFTMPHRLVAVEGHRRAAACVAETVDAYGLDVFNQVWTDPDRVPLREETKGDLAAWTARAGSPEPA
ncbi:hypothetical protein AB0D34_07920 [Streptomyces sp. NPDC048420]|uniref:hypothetical protein n=1 Tax=Streptomyces sp. NPDC048420 TaxID=3155755 RepID=UPI003443885D